MEPGSQVVLEPNATWWGEKPRFRRITVRVIGNTAALEANLLSGSIDMIAGELGLTDSKGWFQRTDRTRRSSSRLDIRWSASLFDRRRVRRWLIGKGRVLERDCQQLQPGLEGRSGLPTDSTTE